jgi:hypothetical protein
MLWRMPADTRTAKIGIMFIHFDGSAGTASDARPEIDSRLLEEGRGAAQPPRRNAPRAPSVGRLLTDRGAATRRQLGCANCANCANPCMQCRRNPLPSGFGICANCPISFCLRNTAPYSGAKEFPIAAAHAGALLFRIAGMEGRSGDRRSAKPVAGIAEIGISPEGRSPPAIPKSLAEIVEIPIPAGHSLHPPPALVLDSQPHV